MTTSKLMCKPITSRTASVTCVSSARNTITRILQKPLRINPLPSDLLSDQTSIPLKQKTAPPIVSISYHSSVQPTPDFWTLFLFLRFEPWFHVQMVLWEKTLCFTPIHTPTSVRITVHKQVGLTSYHAHNQPYTNFIQKTKADFHLHEHT